MRRFAPWIGLLLAACTSRGEPTTAAHEAVASPEAAGVRALGEVLFHGRAGCTACHRLGEFGAAEVGPNLAVGPGFPTPLSRRAHVDEPVLRYLVHSLVDPDAVVVPSYPAGKMPRIEEPPLAFDDDAIVAIATYVASYDPASPPATEAEVAAARAAISEYRATRTHRVAGKFIAQLATRVRWAEADPALGPEVALKRGCTTCHGQDRGALWAALSPPRHERRTQATVLAWLVARLPEHAACTGITSPAELGHLASWLARL